MILLVSDQLFRRLENLSAGRLDLITPDGKKRSFEGSNPGESATLELREWRVVKNMMRKGDVGLQVVPCIN